MGLYGIDCVQWGVQYLPGDEGATVHLLWRENLVEFVRTKGKIGTCTDLVPGDFMSWHPFLVIKRIELVLVGKLCRIDMFSPSTFDLGFFLGYDFDLWARKVPELGFLIN
uniref:Uncharacterized protein n=1 Tax=Tanacetum cinerariifolium TaxID=118510 RepID=A0A699JJS4_TANCI|nr:hypothetical protein [Tanacetum cinerariifolium]